MENVVGIMLQSEHNWEQVAAYIEKVLRQKTEGEYDLARAADRVAENR